VTNYANFPNFFISQRGVTIVKQHLGFSSLLGGAVLSLLAAQSAEAAATKITNVTVKPGNNGVEVVLDTAKGQRPQIVTVRKGDKLITNISNAQLQLPQSQSFVKVHPAPGIDAVQINQIDAKSVEIIVDGNNKLVAGQVNQTEAGIVLNATSTGQLLAQSMVQPVQQQVQQVQQPSFLSQMGGSQDVMVPNPGIQIEGSNIGQPTRGIPPQMNRAVPPPVGDMTFSSTNTAAAEIDLGSNEIIPRLVLRDAPAREVLSLLGRAAGVNIAYVGDGAMPGADGAAAPTPDAAGAAGASPAGADVKVSLDIENEPVQNVFNYVLRVTGLQASRSGRTIFVGRRLPNAARNIIARGVRLNQASVGDALNYLVGLGAESSLSVTRPVRTTERQTRTNLEDGGNSQSDSSTTETEITTVETQRAEYEDSEPLLRGLQVTGNQQTNSLTLVGEPHLVQIAMSQLQQLDVRKRQVAVNVRIIDVNLAASNRSSTSFSFGVDDTRVLNDAGVGIINFGLTSPTTSQIAAEGIGSVTGLRGQAPFNFVRNFLAQLQFAVTSGNAKILTDPTLVVQEGQQAQVSLTQEVVTNLEVREEGTGDERTREVTLEKARAGLILDVKVDRIDDNGFVSMSLSPLVSAPSGTFQSTVQGQDVNITLLAERQLTSGQIRIRDGQTLILSGIIQDRDRTSVTKVPILGDLPILGALFRNSERINERQEVIVLVTPQVLDDSNGSVVGYRYEPAQETQRFMQDRGR
jgi:type IV pilus assembly protein PilQ